MMSGVDEPTSTGMGITLPPEGVALADVERSLVEQALARCHGNQTQAARLLHISRYALRSRIRKFRLDPLLRATPRSSADAEPH